MHISAILECSERSSPSAASVLRAAVALRHAGIGSAFAIACMVADAAGARAPGDQLAPQSRAVVLIRASVLPRFHFDCGPHQERCNARTGVNSGNGVNVHSNYPRFRFSIVDDTDAYPAATGKTRLVLIVPD